MIQPDRTRADFLAAIGAPAVQAPPLSDITDTRIASGDVHVRLCGRAKDDLFPLLELALSERFAAVPRERLLRDLLTPLRKALGNAQKHGNALDPAKSVVVEIVLTRRGGVIAITDEGGGFDVAQTFQRFQEDQHYFVNQGSGFRNFHRAASTVSYENGGRTALLCYQPAEATSQLDPSPPQISAASSRKGLDSQWIETCLSESLPELRERLARVQSCRVYPREDVDCGPRYVLRIAVADGSVETRILTGRLHASATAAETDFAAATHLSGVLTTRLRIPRPVARSGVEPYVVLFDFDPSMALAKYLVYRDSLRSVQHFAERIGVTLAALHGNNTVMPVAGSGTVGEQLPARMARAEGTIETLFPGTDLALRFRDDVQRFAERSGPWMRRNVVPIHGSLGWDSIYYGVDGQFYLYRFENCRLSDPGLDLGGFAADLLCFTLAHYDPDAYRACRNELLKHYNAEAGSQLGADDLRVYTVLGLCQRFEPSEVRPPFNRAQLAAALHFSLQNG